MRVLRLFIAVLLALSLAILPVSAAMARAQAAKADMAMSAPGDTGDDCPCCPAAGKCVASICSLQCFNLTAVLVEGLPATAPVAALFVATAPAAMSPNSRGPDPPPPRF